MRMTRRTLLIGAGSGALAVLLTSCFPEPGPSPTPTHTPPPTPEGGVPAPSASLRSRWATDPFAQGAASVTPVGVQPEARGALARTVEDRVFFAGEATDADRPGTMRGAIASGLRVVADLRRAGPGGRIAVVGAGLAGATVAVQLADGPAEVTVFEARDRIGGRVHSLVDDTWPLPVQLGAWLLGAGDSTLRDRLDELDIRTAMIETPQWQSPDGAVQAPSDAPIVAAIDAARSLPADVSVTEALTQAGVDTQDPAVAGLLAYAAATSGADFDDASAWFPPARPAGEYTAALGSLTPLLDGMVDGVQVRLSSPVSKIVYDDTGVSLRLGTGESLSFDRVVVTVPLGVLKDSSLEFDPVLPFENRGAIADLAMGHIETIWLRFDEPFWDTDATIWHLMGGDAVVRTWINLLPVTGENVLVGLVGGAAAEEFANLDDGQAVAAATASLELMIPEEIAGS